MTTPACRTLTIPAEDRTLVIEAMTGSAVLIVIGNIAYWGLSYWGGSYWGGLYWTTIAGTVAVTGTPTERTFVIPAENRTLIIKACGDGGTTT